MTDSIPKWVQERFSKLYNKYNDKTITFKMIKKVLTMDDDNTIRVFINQLKKAKWIDVKLSEETSRERVYTLREPNKILMEISQNGNTGNKSRVR